MEKSFGKDCMFFMCSFTGALTQADCPKLLKEIVEIVGMRPSHAPVTFDYEGDLGFIVCQPLIESMVFLDYWIRHTGGFLTLDSCKAFFPQNVERVMSSYGLIVHQRKVEGLSLP